jgi:hypothetical protein
MSHKTNLHRTRITQNRPVDFANIETNRFQIALHHSLDKGCDFSNFSNRECKALQRFISKTVGRHASWADVDQQLLRRRSGATYREEFYDGEVRRVAHYEVGKGRLFGYRLHDHLVVVRLDPNHQFDS